MSSSLGRNGQLLNNLYNFYQAASPAYRYNALNQLGRDYRVARKQVHAHHADYTVSAYSRYSALIGISINFPNRGQHKSIASHVMFWDTLLVYLPFRRIQTRPQPLAPTLWYLLLVGNHFLGLISLSLMHFKAEGDRRDAALVHQRWSRVRTMVHSGQLRNRHAQAAMTNAVRAYTLSRITSK